MFTVNPTESRHNIIPFRTIIRFPPQAFVRLVPPNGIVDPEKEKFCYVDVKDYTMDGSEIKECQEPNIMPMPQILINNPNISIIPTKSNQSLTQPSNSRTTRGTVPISPPVSVVPVIQNEAAKLNDPKESKTSYKRNATTPILNKPEKMPRLSTSKVPKKKERKFDPKLFDSNSKLSLIKDKIKKCNSSISSKINNINEVPSMSSSEIRVPQESTNIQNTNKSTISKHLNCNADLTTIVSKNVPNDINQQKFTINFTSGMKKDTQPSEKNMKITTFEVVSNESINESLATDITNQIRTYLKNHFNKDHSNKLETPKEISIVQSSENNGSSSKTQSTTHVKSQKIVNQPQTCTAMQPQPPITTIQVSSNTKCNNLSSSKVQQSVKQNDIKPNTSSVVQLPITTLTPIPSANKQIIVNQQPTTSKHSMVSVTSSVTSKKIAGPSTNGKSAVCQTLPPEVKKCSKCNALLEDDDDVCSPCHMSAHLKGVTVIRIEKPGTSVPNNNEDVQIISLSSDDDDDEESLGNQIIEEPIINRVESDEVLHNYLKKIHSNPKFLEGTLWQREFGVKDYFKFDNCYSVQIGSFKTVPVGDILICVYGIRMTINNIDSEPVTIDVQMDNIAKVFGFFATKPIMIIYIDYLATVGVQHLLNMKEENPKYYFNPLSKKQIHKSIVWSFELNKNEVVPLEKLMLNLPKEKYQLLTLDQAKNLRILQKKLALSMNDEMNKKQSVSDYNNFTLILDKLFSSALILKINDYKTIAIDEFVNDVIVEYHLARYYNDKLNDDIKQRTYIFSTYFYTTLTKIKPIIDPREDREGKLTRHERVKRWTKNVNIFEKDFIFIPVNESFHWYLIVICYPYLTGPVHFETGAPMKVQNEDPKFSPRNLKCDSVVIDRDEADGNTEDLTYYAPNYVDVNEGTYESDVEKLRKRNRIPIKQPCILVFDSLSGGANRARVVATLREWLEEEYCAKYNGVKRDFSHRVLKGSLVKIPQQPNYTDCGLFVMHYFECFFLKPIVDYTLPICHLENWFDSDEVTLDCKKRREVQQLILQGIKRQGTILPPGVSLPVLKFVLPPNHPNHPNNIGLSLSQHNNLIQNKEMERQIVNSENVVNEEVDVDENDFIEEDEDMFNEEDQQYDYDGDYVDGEDCYDAEYYAREDANEDWSEQHEGNGHYSEYDHHDMQSYRMSRLARRNTNGDDDSEEDEDEDEDSDIESHEEEEEEEEEEEDDNEDEEEPNQLPIVHSKRRGAPRYNHG